MRSGRRRSRTRPRSCRSSAPPSPTSCSTGPPTSPTRSRSSCSGRTASPTRWCRPRCPPARSRRSSSPHGRLAVAASELAQYVVTGLLVGGVYALMSIGLALIFGIMRVVNFAQGDFMMLGMYVTYFLTTAYGIDPLLGAVLILPPFFLLGVAVYRVLLARVTGGGDPQR